MCPRMFLEMNFVGSFNNLIFIGHICSLSLHIDACAELSFMWECRVGKPKFIASTFVYIEETEKSCHYDPNTLSKLNIASHVVKMCRLPKYSTIGKLGLRFGFAIAQCEQTFIAVRVFRNLKSVRNVYFPLQRMLLWLIVTQFKLNITVISK